MWPQIWLFEAAERYSTRPQGRIGKAAAGDFNLNTVKREMCNKMH